MLLGWYALVDLSNLFLLLIFLQVGGMGGDNDDDDDDDDDDESLPSPGGEERVNEDEGEDGGD